MPDPQRIPLRPPLNPPDFGDVPPASSAEDIIRKSIPSMQKRLLPEDAWNPFEGNYFDTPEGGRYAQPAPWRDWESPYKAHEEQQYQNWKYDEEVERLNRQQPIQAIPQFMPGFKAPPPRPNPRFPQG